MALFGGWCFRHDDFTENLHHGLESDFGRVVLWNSSSSQRSSFFWLLLLCTLCILPWRSFYRTSFSISLRHMFLFLRLLLRVLLLFLLLACLLWFLIWFLTLLTSFFRLLPASVSCSLSSLSELGRLHGFVAFLFEDLEAAAGLRSCAICQFCASPRGGWKSCQETSWLYVVLAGVESVASGSWSESASGNLKRSAKSNTSCSLSIFLSVFSFLGSSSSSFHAPMLTSSSTSLWSPSDRPARSSMDSMVFLTCANIIYAHRNVSQGHNNTNCRQRTCIRMLAFAWSDWESLEKTLFLTSFFSLQIRKFHKRILKVMTLEVFIIRSTCVPDLSLLHQSLQRHQHSGRIDFPVLGHILDHMANLWAGPSHPARAG